MKISSKRWFYAVWLLMIGGFAVLHALNLTADFPNHTPWFSDWAKYTDEGWYGNAAIRAHLQHGHWYLPGDFNPFPAVPVWPFLEWMLFFVTGVTVQAARGLAVAFFFANLVLSYLLLRTRGPRWMALLALTLVVTSPFLYCFSRLAILEPMLTALMLGALNVAVRLPRMRRPLLAAVSIGLLYTLMMLTKTTAVFLLPALGWAILLPLWHNRKLALRCAMAAAGTFLVTFGMWMAMVIGHNLLGDYKYLFYINKYVKPKEFYWPLLSFWWSFHGGLWVDRILIPLAGLLLLGAAVAWWRSKSPVEGASTGWSDGVPADRSSSVGWSAWGRKLLLDPVFGASVLAAAGYIFFMTYQNHPQPRYFALVAFFCFFMVAQGTESLLSQAGEACGPWARRLGWAALGLAVAAVGINTVWTLNFVTHPEYTFVTAARQLTQYIDEHPNGKRLLVSISGDEITLVTHLPALCDDFGTATPRGRFPDLASKLAYYKPGWYATWNDLDPGTLEDLHNRFSLEQVATFRAFDDPERNRLVLFKLHPLRSGLHRDPTAQDLQVPLPGDQIDIPIE
ncbi:MAG: hypothetical protein P4K86_12480 [Terracidiphilus sp.]|nr:hypothetical protein [Terracidiphilus sp.]MDR3775263.1 hypothetical protein [Terracidiphilus sp.]